jgi:hypothetical protein
MKSKYHENQGDFHVGKILKSYIDKHKIAKSALARKIKRGGQHYYSLPKKCFHTNQYCE